MAWIWIDLSHAPKCWNFSFLGWGGGGAVLLRCRYFLFCMTGSRGRYHVNGLRRVSTFFIIVNLRVQRDSVSCSFFFSIRLWRLPCSNLNRKVLQLWPITQRSRLWKSVLQYCNVHGTTSMVYILFLLMLVLNCPTQDPLLQ